MTEPTPVLRIRSMAKRFGETCALAGVSFDVLPGRVHALLGGNGSGKSTLIKALAGVQPADAGSIDICGREYMARDMCATTSRDVGLRFVHQQQSTCSRLSVSENLALGPGFLTGPAGRIRWRAQRELAQAALKRFQIDARPEQRLGSLTPANQTMVAIARALQDVDPGQHPILVLDEPTASLPAAEVDLLLSALRDYAASGATILYVSHRLEEVVKVADSATILRNGNVVDTLGDREVSHARIVRGIVGHDLTPSPPSQLASVERSVAPIIQAEDLCGGPVQGVSFKLWPGEVVGIAGLLGSGRSALLKMLFGLSSPDGGRVCVDGEVIRIADARTARRLGISYVPEDRATQGLFKDMSVLENLSITCVRSYWKGGRVRRRDERHDARALIRQYLIGTRDEHTRVEHLSGGNQQKILIARAMRTRPRVLLLDEPTQGVDIGARAEIYTMIRRAVADGLAVLLVSSEMEELAELSDRVVVLRAGRTVGRLAAPFDDQQLNRAIMEKTA